MMRRTLSTVEGLTNGPAKVRVVSLVVVFICLLFLLLQPGDVAEALSNDGVHLLAFKKAFTCASSEVLADWNQNDSDPCAWSGVECDPKSLRVVSLRIVGRGADQYRAQSTCPVPYRRSSLDDGTGGGGADRGPCELSGTLSPAIWKLSKLRRLFIPFNNLTGEIPKDIAHLKALRILDLRSNLLEGRLPSELGKLPNLRFLNLDNNAFQGNIPAELSLCHELRGLRLAGNMLSGSIPASLGSLPRLHKLSLSNNQLVGSIPGELVAGECTLSYLDLSGNRLSGNIPREITACSRLTRLLLNFNNLVGSIPSDLGHLSSLKALEVAGNSLSGLLPAQLAECSKLEFLVLTSHHTWSACLNRTEGNSFRGALPPGLALLPNLRVLWAPGAGLGERLPVNWGRCEKLESLNLALNVFTGEISLGLRSCKSLLFLDLSSNQLTGKIPSQLPVKSTRVFNVTGNVLSGRVPEVPADSLGRSHLCNSDFPSGSGTYRFGSQPEWQTTCVLNWSYDNFKGDVARPPLRRSTLDDYSNSFASTEGPAASQMQTQRKLNSILVAAITSGCAIAVVLFVLGLVFQCTRHRIPRRPSPQPGRKGVVTFTNVNYNLTYESVVKATGNFSIDNLIGSGGFGATYKAEVKPGLLVAVKRLAIGRCQGMQQFDTEIRTLGRIRHPNLVTLIGYHASQEEMFLIYNFFSKGNLETLIHGQKEEMDWKTRHSIALRIAEALAYLHDDCLPRVLHRDIKPSNILLDDNLNAHLSDFGLARLLGASETHATTDVAGTFGYVAPEYAMTCRVTDKADVYSYGVVLLELLSGKRALDPSFAEYGNGFNIVSWACLLIRQGRAYDVFTVRLWEQGPEKNLLETLKLAVLCTVDQLSVRPTMRKVVDTLGEIRPVVSTI